MGSACCVAAKGRSVPERTGEKGLHRAGYSPKCGSGLNGNHVPITRENENPTCQNSHLTSRNVSMEFKGPLSSERGHSSDGGSTLENSATPISQKSPFDDTFVPNLIATPSDLSISSKFSMMNSVDSSIPNHSFPIPPVFSSPALDPHSNSTPSRRAHRSPGHPLLRQISDSQILGLKSPGYSISEGRPSFVFSPCSNEMATGSLYGSSDGWSMRTFSEMVASSQREICSSDSEYLGSGRHKIIGSSSSRFLHSPSMDQQSCPACARPLTELPNFVARSDVSCVAILVCGHAYHAECLESRTAEANKFDPACPACIVGDNHSSKSSRKDIRVESETSKGKHQKISRSRVADSYLESDVNVSEPQKDIERIGKVSKMEPSSSTRSTHGKPFLKKHFSFRSKSNRTLMENDTARTKGFWGRHRKE
ncbi:hypothetical protein HN51_015543 [Arachis hypogaea]|uniref:RING-type domain-containing protein n=1 Tax=Arachis hypogaea TaxID=3818 RepID=A0A445CK39_ARAHY|nr:uncharacterized protein LOC112696327 [Arachis hypogaea]QHO46020.1 uncharacterized protein DS421_6g183760 [Arachis hypogaea]RYR51306.1 hypothetical protein Ahy_A06g026328 isoform A [Arachis hypogaea]